MRVFIDLDGVLVNMHQPACEVFGLPYPKQSVLYFDWLFKQCDVSIEDFLNKLDSTPGFWENLQLFPWASALITLVEKYDPNWQILTAATMDPVSWQGKAAWVRRTFGEAGMRRLIMVHGNKSKLAARDVMLIDDHKAWCTGWARAGGLEVFHWVEYTPDREELWQAQLVKLEECLGLANSLI